jgi:hypothetical protein
MLPLSLVLVLSLALALVCSAIPWLAHPLPGWLLAMALVVGITANLLGMVLALPLYPWLDLVVLVVAWSGGLLLGRSVAPSFRPFLLVFLCLSATDVLLTGGLTLSSRHAAAMAGSNTVGGATPLRFGDFLLLLPWGRLETNVVDVLLLTALAEHWHRRGATYLIALLPGAVGYILAVGVILVTGLGIVPGIPFFTAGYVVTEAVYRYTAHRRQAAPSPATMAG